jgi:hypothetical protein
MSCTPDSSGIDVTLVGLLPATRYFIRVTLR